MVDSRKNEAELEEEKKKAPAESVEDKPEVPEQELPLKMEDRKEAKAGEEQAEAAARNEPEKAGGRIMPNEVLEKVEGQKEDGVPLKEVKHLDPVKDAENEAPAANQAAGAQVNEAGKPAEKGQHLNLRFKPVSTNENLNKNGHFACDVCVLSAALPEGEHHPAERVADSKDTADEKMEGKINWNLSFEFSNTVLFKFPL